VRVVRDIPYKNGSEQTAYEKERCKLDLYLPEGGSGFATMVWFYGGGLRGGQKNDALTVQIARRFAAEGVAVAVVDYRLSPRVGFPAYIRDAASGFAWVHGNIAGHGGDSGRLFVSGHSAGGYLTAMLGLDATYLREHGLTTAAIAGLIPISGQMITHSTVRAERGIPGTRPFVDAAAPSFHVRSDAPPVLAICGGEDVPARAAENFYFVEAMKAVGHDRIAYLEVAGRTHSTIVALIPQRDDVVAEAILKFIANE
jgi:acetyl esterase/lipase